MGLDVYLYRCPDRLRAEQIEQEVEDKCDAIWAEYPGQYKDLTEQQKTEADERCETVRVTAGIVQYHHHSVQKVEIDSVKYPQHMFKIGYFRSSYNEGGIEHVLQDAQLPGLYEIFGAQWDQNPVIPNWEEALGRARSVLEGLKQYAGGEKGKYSAMFADSYNAFAGPDSINITNTSEALQRYFQEVAEGKLSSSYSNMGGHFFLDKPLTVVAAICGKNSLGTPGVYLVYEAPNTYGWYIEALEIVVETIEYVLVQPDREQYYMRWSG